MAEWKIKANKWRSAISNLNNDEDAHFSLPGKANQIEFTYYVFIATTVTSVALLLISAMLPRHSNHPKTSPLPFFYTLRSTCGLS